MTQQLSQNDTIPTPTENRLPTIIDNIMQGKTHQQIADTLGISRKTVERDLTTWVHSPEWTTWLAGQWIELYNKLKRTDKEQVAFNGLTQLLKRSGVQVNIQQNNITAIKLIWEKKEQLVGGEKEE